MIQVHGRIPEAGDVIEVEMTRSMVHLTGTVLETHRGGYEVQWDNFHGGTFTGFLLATDTATVEVKLPCEICSRRLDTRMNTSCYSDTHREFILAHGNEHLVCPDCLSRLIEAGWDFLRGG